MSYMDLYKKRVTSKGKTIYDRILTEKKENFYKYLARTPQREEIKIIDPTQIEQTNEIYIVSILEKKEQEKAKYFQILSPLEVPLEQGTLVEWEKAIWMIFIDQEKHKKTYFKGVLKKCNNLLKWIDKYGHLCSVNCYIAGNTGPDFEYKTSGSGFGSAFQFSYAKVTGDIEIVLPKNRQTQLLKEQDSFILNNNSKWELTCFDDFSYEGLIGLLLKRVMKNSIDDDLENNIADSDRLNEWKIIIENGLLYSLISKGDSQQLDIKLYQNDNIVVKDFPKLNFTIEDPKIIDFDLTTYTITALEDGETTLKIFIDECIDFFVEIKVEVGGISVLESHYSITGNETIKEGGNEYKYIVKRIYNGKEDILADFNFSTVDPRKIIQLTKIDRNTCVLKTNNQNRYGNIKLIVSDGIERIEKTINIESLF